MNCAEAQTILSAGLDGEAGELELAAAKTHARRCPACGAFEHDVTTLAVARPERPAVSFPGHTRGLRAGLLGAGLAGLVLGLPQLLGYNLGSLAGVSNTHLARDGALGCVLAIAVIAAARRPRWSTPLAVVAVAVFGLQVVAGVTDNVGRRVSGRFELIHVAGAATVALIVAAAVRGRARLTSTGVRGPQLLDE